MLLPRPPFAAACWVFALPQLTVTAGNPAVLSAEGDILPSDKAKGIADKFCVLKGYTKSVTYQLQPAAGLIWPFGTLTVAGAPGDVTGFTYVICGTSTDPTCANDDKGNVSQLACLGACMLCLLCCILAGPAAARLACTPAQRADLQPAPLFSFICRLASGTPVTTTSATTTPAT